MDSASCDERRQRSEEGLVETMRWEAAGEKEHRAEEYNDDMFKHHPRPRRRLEKGTRVVL